MQAISLMSLAAGQTGPVPAQGGSQTATATAANAGLFQGMLLEALLGGQIAPELAAQLQMAPQPAGTANGQVAAKAPEGSQTQGVLLSGPATVGIAPVPAPDEPAQAAAQAPVENQAQTRSQPTAAPPVTVKPQILPPVPLVDEPAAEAAAQPAVPKAKQTPETQQQPATPDAVLAQVLMQGQVAVPQPAAAAPTTAAPTPQTGAPAVVAEQTAADPQLEAFVQRAVKLAEGEQPEAPAAEAKAPAGPTFQDLVKLVAGAGQAGDAKSDAQTETQLNQQAQPQQPHPVLKAAAEQHDQTTASAPAPVKAPKAAQSPEKPADVNLAQAPRPVAHEASTAASDAPQAAPRQPVDPEQVIRQVSRFVKVMVDSKQSEVRLQLHPENLGSVGVRLVLDEGTLKANLTAQDASVKAALEANLDQLKGRLSDQGFQVEQVHVTVGGGDGGFGQPQHSRQGEQRQPQQPWRSQAWQNGQDEESSPNQYNLRTAPTWFLKGTGARINSLA